MTQQDIKDFIESINQVAQEKEGCAFYILDTDVNGNEWAIVFGWQDGYDERNDCMYCDGTWRMCGKVAYSSGYMKSDYDIDWETDFDAYDIELTEDTDIEKVIKQLLEVFEAIKSEEKELFE